jgi:hypothetical protein
VRYRLRFLMQEVDLPPGITSIGRSLDCNLTVEDPLVSRQHARLIIDENGARVEDLNSRNGVRVNGSVVRAPTPLRDGDRLRIGTQEFVFCRVDVRKGAHARTTGVLRLCGNCRLPYPREAFACPHCEATEQTDDTTELTGDDEESSPGFDDRKATWSVQLLVEALERALTLGRMADAERIVRRATVQLDELLLSGRAIDVQALGAVAAKVASMTLATNDPTWVLWVLDLYRRVSSVPSLDVADRLAEAALKHSGVVRAPLRGLLDHLSATVHSASLEEIEALTRLEGSAA